MDSHYRSIAKAISWRIAAVTITTSVAWAISGEIRFAAAVGVIDSALKIGLFYLHERAWNRTSFGRDRQSQYE